MKIAIIDDHNTTIKNITLNLDQIGYKNVLPIHCKTYRDVTTELRDNKVGFAIVDLELGNDRFGGNKIVKDIKNKFPIPTLYYSGLPIIDVLNAIQQKPANSFLHKMWKKREKASGVYINKLVGHENLKKGIALALGNYKEDVKGIRKLIGRKEVWLLVCKRDFATFYLDEIVYIKSFGNYVKIFLSNGNFHVPYEKYTLKEFYHKHFEAYSDDFIQISRSYILNIKYMKTFPSNRKVTLMNNLFPNEPITFGKEQFRKFKTSKLL